MRKLYILLLFVSCSKSAEVKPQVYFSLEQYFLKEASRLTAEHKKLVKELQTGEVEEKIKLDSTDWKAILQPFASGDINKAAWINSYLTDSTSSDSAVTVRYAATEEDIPVREIILVASNGIIESVKIVKSKKNFYYESEETYWYSPNRFKIEGHQQVRFLESRNYTIKGDFVN